MKKYVLLLVVSAALCNINVYSQTKNGVTPQMAIKISYFCQNNSRAFGLFQIITGNEARMDLADKILRDLPNQLNYAEKFIIILYDNYGVERSYFALKGAGFTIEETGIAEKLWRQREKERKVAADKRAEQKDKDILTRIENNDLFSASELFQSASMTIDVENLATYIKTRYEVNTSNKDIPAECSFDFIVLRNGNLLLNNFKDTLSFSEPQRLIYQYIISNISKENIQPATIKLANANKTVNVNSIIHLQCNEKEDYYAVEITMEKNKKTQQWKIKNEPNIKEYLNKINPDNADNFYSEFEKLLYTNSSFTDIKKGNYTTQLVISAQKIICIMNQQTIGVGKLGYSLELTPPKNVQKTTNPLWQTIIRTGINGVLLH